MCGIVGIYDQTRTGRADPGTVRAMAQAVAHRGPDGAGFFAWPREAPNVALGVRRLSIIDMVTGDQPLFNEDRTMALVFNGEISNFVELRSELEQRGHVFSTRSDTETILHLYEEDGLDLFGRLRGMFAFALWDSRQERLVLAVDHVGIKPLYITEHDGRVIFGSEVKALLAGEEAPRGVDADAIDAYLSFGYILGPATLYSGIRRLPPGHALVLHGSRSDLIRYKSFSSTPGPSGAVADRDLADETYRALTEAVRLHLRSDVPVGLFLSGGIDSASLLAMMSPSASEPVETFSVGYRGSSGSRFPDDETDHARRIAAHFGARHRELTLAADDWWTALLGYVRAHDEPNADPASISLFALSEMASASVKVVLSGLGGDEVFGGYAFHRRYPARIRQGEWLQRRWPGFARSWGHGAAWDFAEASFPSVRRMRWVGGLLAQLIELRSLCDPMPSALRRRISYDGLVFSDHLRSNLYNPSLRRASQEGSYVERVFAEFIRQIRSVDPADVVQQLWLQVWLPGSGLLALDKITMAHSLEARVPFFDPNLMAFVLKIPPSIRLKGNKHLLRQAMRGHLPDFVLRRPKRPFSTPIRSWFDNELADRIQGVLLDPRCLGRGWFNPDALATLVRRHFRRETDHTELIFRLLVFELWQQSTIDPPPRAEDPFLGDSA